MTRRIMCIAMHIVLIVLISYRIAYCRSWQAMCSKGDVQAQMVEYDEYSDWQNALGICHTQYSPSIGLEESFGVTWEHLTTPAEDTQRTLWAESEEMLMHEQCRYGVYAVAFQNCCRLPR